MKKEIKIPAIKDGVVIDHIPCTARKIIQILGIGPESVWTIGINLDSKKMGKKDVVKIENKIPTKAELNKIALVAPQATVSLIENYQIKEKVRIEIPPIFEGVIKCSNEKCVTNNQNIKTRFVLKNKNPLKMSCHYCERLYDREEIELI